MTTLKRGPYPQGPALPVRTHGFDRSASAWTAINVDSSGHIAMKHALEFEVDGTSCLVRAFNISATGTNTITAVSSGLKLYKAFASFESDVSGNVVLEMDANEIGRLRNPIVGGNHIFISPSPNYEEITATGTVKVVLPTATAMVAATITLHYE
jgi:hypothetical protein